MEKKTLQGDIEYIIIQNEDTGEIIAKITNENTEVIKPYMVRIKYQKSKELDTTNT